MEFRLRPLPPFFNILPSGIALIDSVRRAESIGERKQIKKAPQKKVSDFRIKKIECDNSGRVSEYSWGENIIHFPIRKEKRWKALAVGFQTPFSDWKMDITRQNYDRFLSEPYCKPLFAKTPVRIDHNFAVLCAVTKTCLGTICSRIFYDFIYSKYYCCSNFNFTFDWEIF